MLKTVVLLNTFVETEILYFRVLWTQKKVQKNRIYLK